VSFRKSRELTTSLNPLGYNKDKKACFFLQHNIFGDNIYNPSIIFDTEKHEWTKPVTIKQL